MAGRYSARGGYGDVCDWRDKAMNHIAAAGHLLAIVTACSAYLARSRRAAEVAVTVTQKPAAAIAPLSAAAGPPDDARAPPC